MLYALTATPGSNLSAEFLSKSSEEPSQPIEKSFQSQLGQLVSDPPPQQAASPGQSRGATQQPERQAADTPTANRQLFVSAAGTSQPDQATLAPQPLASGTGSPAPPRNAIEAALQGATVNGVVDAEKLAALLGGRIVYEPPDWSGSGMQPANPLQDTWLYLPTGGTINVGNMLFSLNTLNPPGQGLGALTAMIDTANRFFGWGT
jgi:hypothetical protein